MHTQDQHISSAIIVAGYYCRTAKPNASMMHTLSHARNERKKCNCLFQTFGEILSEEWSPFGPAMMFNTTAYVAKISSETLLYPKAIRGLCLQ